MNGERTKGRKAERPPSRAFKSCVTLFERRTSRIQSVPCLRKEHIFNQTDDERKEKTTCNFLSFNRKEEAINRETRGQKLARVAEQKRTSYGTKGFRISVDGLVAGLVAGLVMICGLRQFPLCRWWTQTITFTNTKFTRPNNQISKSTLRSIECEGSPCDRN